MTDVMSINAYHATLRGSGDTVHNLYSIVYAAVFDLKANISAATEKHLAGVLSTHKSMGMTLRGVLSFPCVEPHAFGLLKRR